MLTTDEQALMNAIVAAPDDDAPRLIYADWLDENDQPERAEFIRVQCELARLPRWKTRAELLREHELTQREQVLLDEYAYRWFGIHGHVIRQPVKGAMNRSITQRGFVGYGHLAGKLWQSQWPELARQRTLDGLGLHDLRDASMYDLLAIPELTGLRRLDIFVGQERGAIWPFLTAASRLRQLRSLGLIGGPLPSVETNFLATNPVLAKLTDLTFHSSLTAFEPFMEHVRCQLRRLNLCESFYQPSWIPPLHALPMLDQLEHLELANAMISGRTIDHLVTASFWSRLRSLKLNFTAWEHTNENFPVAFRGESVLDVLSSQAATSLVEFSFTVHHLHSADVLHGTLLTNVRHLELRLLRDELDADLILEMAESSYTRNLRSVRFAGSGESMDRVAEALAISPGFNQLLEVDLSESTLSTRGAYALANAPHLRDLTRLTLTGCKLDETVLAVLRERFPIVVH